MAQLRFTVVTMVAFVALAAFALDSTAQQPQQPGGNRGGGGGRGGGQGRGGPGGFGGFGFGFGGPGGPFGSSLGLAANPGVQAEIKATEKQKTQIKSLSDKLNQEMQELRTQMGMGGGPGGGPGVNGPAGGQNRQNGGGRRNRNGNGGAQAGQANPGGGGGAGNAGDGGQNGQGGGGGGQNGQGGGNRGNRFQMDPEKAEQFAAMRETMNELRQKSELALGKVLEKGQLSRIEQIKLQLEGPNVVFRDDIIERLGISDEQLEMLNELRDEERQASREMRKTQFEFFRTRFPNPNPGGGNGGQAGGNGGNGGNGPQGKNRFRFDPEAMKKVMEDPEVKAQMDENRTQTQKLENQFYAGINKILYPRQRAALKKMVGAPFDRSKLGFGGPWGGPPGGPGAGKAATKNGAASGTAAAAKSSTGDDDDESGASNAPAAKTPAKAKAGTSSRRKSLRDLRGSSSESDQ